MCGAAGNDELAATPKATNHFAVSAPSRSCSKYLLSRRAMMLHIVPELMTAKVFTSEALVVGTHIPRIRN